MYIKINETLYPCAIKGTHVDHTWGNRNSQAITLEMDGATAASLFVDNVEWSVVHGEPMTDPETLETIPAPEIDMSDFCVAGPITDNRDGTVTVKMGKKTDGEMLTELLEVLNND